MQLEGHAVDQVLGGSGLHAAQILHIMDSLPVPPSTEQSLDADGRPVVVLEDRVLQPLLQVFPQCPPNPKAAPPALDGNCRLPALMDQLSDAVATPMGLDATCRNEHLVVDQVNRGSFE